MAESVAEEIPKAGGYIRLNLPHWLAVLNVVYFPYDHSI